MKVYKLDFLTYVADRSWLMPTEMGVTMAHFYYDEIHKWVWHHYKDWWGTMGITRVMAEAMMIKYFCMLKYGKGFSSDASLTGAIANFKDYVARQAAFVPMLALSLMVAFAEFVVVCKIVDWFAEKTGTFDFHEGAVIFQYEERLWWGGVIGHPASRVWDFYVCAEIGEHTFMHRPGYPKSILPFDEFDFGGMWQDVIKGSFGWLTMNYHVMRLEYLGLAHDRGFGRRRLTVDPFASEPYNYPVSWGLTEFQVCDPFDHLPVP